MQYSKSTCARKRYQRFNSSSCSGRRNTCSNHSRRSTLRGLGSRRSNDLMVHDSRSNCSIVALLTGSAVPIAPVVPPLRSLQTVQLDSSWINVQTFNGSTTEGIFGVSRIPETSKSAKSYSSRSSGLRSLPAENGAFSIREPLAINDLKETCGECLKQRSRHPHCDNKRGTTGARNLLDRAAT